jgi:methionyl aminopeptidase
VGDIGHHVEKFCEAHGYGVVRDFVGHGIGRRLHEDPAVPNFGKAGTGVPLKPGMCIAIEPMITLGTWEAEILDDGWTVVTADRSISAHFEHTVLITQNEPEILTKLV